METRSVKIWSLLPWVFGVVLLAGGFGPQTSVVVFDRAVLLIAAVLATAGSFAAMRCFERGDLLFRTWGVLGTAYFLLTVRYVIRALVTLKVMQTPVMFDRVMLIIHNVLVPVGLLLFIVAWRRSGIASSLSRGAMIGWTVAGFAVAIAIGAFPLMHDIHNPEPAGLISTLGDMAGIAMIVPLLMPALAMRGGLLMYTWLYLAAAQVVWLAYDIWAVARPLTGISSAWGLAIDQALRAVALVYIYSAAAAQKRAITRAREPQSVGAGSAMAAASQSTL